MPKVRQILDDWKTASTRWTWRGSLCPTLFPNLFLGDLQSPKPANSLSLLFIFFFKSFFFFFYTELYIVLNCFPKQSHLHPKRLIHSLGFLDSYPFSMFNKFFSLFPLGELVSLMVVWGQRKYRTLLSPNLILNKTYRIFQCLPPTPRLHVSDAPEEPGSWKAAHQTICTAHRLGCGTNNQGLLASQPTVDSWAGHIRLVKKQGLLA